MRNPLALLILHSKRTDVYGERIDISRHLHRVRKTIAIITRIHQSVKRGLYELKPNNVRLPPSILGPSDAWRVSESSVRIGNDKERSTVQMRTDIHRKRWRQGK